MKKNKLSVVSLRMKLNSMKYSRAQIKKLNEYDRIKAFGWNECVDEMLLYLKNEKDGL